MEVIALPVKFETVLYEKDILEGQSLLETMQGMIGAVEKVIADLQPLI